MNFAKVLFNLMGFDVRIKDLLVILGVFAVLLGAGYAVDAVKTHFADIAKTEKANAALIAERDRLIRLNADNQKISREKETISASNESIAASERVEEKIRVKTQKDIVYVIQKAKPALDSRALEPVAPVVRDVTNRMWGQCEVAPGSGEGKSSSC